MDYSLTGIAYFFVSLALGMMAYRFFTHWQREKNKVAEFFFLFTLSVLLSLLFSTIGSLFFAHNTQILGISVVAAAFFQSFVAAIIAYLVVYIKFQKISPKLAFGIFLILGFIATALTVIYPSHPYIDVSGSINWDVQPAPSILRTVIFLLTFLTLLVILAQQYKNAQSKEVKERSMGIMLIIFFGIFIAFSDFTFGTIFHLPAISSVISGGILSVIAFIFIIFTGRPQSQNLENVNNEI